VGDYVYASDWCYGQIVEIFEDCVRVEYETFNGGGNMLFTYDEIRFPAPAEEDKTGLKVINLSKTMDILLGKGREDMYFLERALIRHNGKSKPGNYNLFSTRVRSVPIERLQDYINNPNVILVKIDDA
jgi:hypothetical protein